MRDFSLSVNFCSMLIEWIALVIFFSKLEKRGEGLLHSLAFLFLLPMLFIYLPIIPEFDSTRMYSFENLVNQLARTLINWCSVWMFVFFSKEKKPVTSVYISAIYILIYMVSFNMREAMRPLLQSISEEYFQTAMLLTLAFFLFSIVLIARRIIDFDEIDKIGTSRWVMITTALLIELYFKWSLVAPPDMINQRPGDTFFYSLCATAGVLILVLLFEMEAAARQKHSRLEMERLQIQYEMQNAKRAIQANSDIRRLYHDMKNHIIALQGMDSGAMAQNYLSELSHEFDEYECNINTGNSVVDTLLYEKLQRARLHNIGFNICVDLKELDFVHSFDMVTIFGNAVDNAIEAITELPDESDRIVYIKSMHYANMIYIRFSNKFVGELVKNNGVLTTKKADTEMHGIGLSSIKKAAKRYNGGVNTEFENGDGWFRLSVMLPVPEKE